MTQQHDTTVVVGQCWQGQRRVLTLVRLHSGTSLESSAALSCRQHRNSAMEASANGGAQLNCHQAGVTCMRAPQILRYLWRAELSADSTQPNSAHLTRLTWPLLLASEEQTALSNFTLSATVHTQPRFVADLDCQQLGVVVSDARRANRICLLQQRLCFRADPTCLRQCPRPRMSGGGPPLCSNPRSP